LGPLTGQHQPAASRYIGAASREAHRRARIAALDATLADLTQEIDTVCTALEALSTLRSALRLAAEALPSTAALRNALRLRAELRSSYAFYEEQHARAEQAARETERAAIQARAKVDTLARAASLPADPEGRARIEAALLGFRDAVTRLMELQAAQVAQAETVHRLTDQTRTLSTRHAQQHEEARQEADRLAQAQRQLQAAEEAQGADLRALQARLAAAREAERAAADALHHHRDTANAARQEAVRAEANRDAAAKQKPDV
jgi:chromosome segregation ATPase